MGSNWRKLPGFQRWLLRKCFPQGPVQERRIWSNTRKQLIRGTFKLLLLMYCFASTPLFRLLPKDNRKRSGQCTSMSRPTNLTFPWRYGLSENDKAVSGLVIQTCRTSESGIVEISLNKSLDFRGPLCVWDVSWMY